LPRSQEKYHEFLGVFRGAFRNIGGGASRIVAHAPAPGATERFRCLCAHLGYRLKGHAAIAGKEDKNNKIKSKPNEPSTAEPARRTACYPILLDFHS